VLLSERPQHDDTTPGEPCLPHGESQGTAPRHSRCSGNQPSGVTPMKGALAWLIGIPIPIIIILYLLDVF
ncbi:MAG: hypothetical protein EON48_02955, partial [Acetobacteraceae bacterium]